MLPLGTNITAEFFAFGVRIFRPSCDPTPKLSSLARSDVRMSSKGSDILIEGCISDPSFHRCCKMAEVLRNAGISVQVSVEPMHEAAFDEFLEGKKKQVGGSIFEHKARHLVLSDGGRKYMGGVEELISFAESMIAPPFDRGEDDKTNWVDIARQECEKQLVSTGSSLVYMDIALDPSLRPRRVMLQLFNKNCPTTCENFRALCTGEKGKSDAGDKLYYKGSPFHRVVRDAWVQGGDILTGAGDGGVSIYGEVFGDESFAVDLNESGILAMANDGPHTNGSQFLVTLAPQPWLNHKVVGFGRVLMGMEVLREMGEVETLNQRPVMECKVNKCGEVTPAEYATIACK